jgi:hypothetical protein
LSKIALSGNLSGTGTFTIASPNSNSDRTLNLPDASGTVLTTATPGVPVNGPAFFASRASGQSISASTNTKLQFTSEQFDTNNCFDSSTNYRFTPNVEGYYQISIGASVQNANTNYYIDVTLSKNGSNAYGSTLFGGGSNGVSYFRGSATVVIYCNGTTDYLEVYMLSNQNQTTDFCYFSGALIRSAA